MRSLSLKASTISLVFAIFIHWVALAQTDKPFDFISKPTPNTNSSTGTLNSSVNHVNGTMNINLPIHTVSSPIGNLSVPVSLAYNSAPLQLNKYPSDIGMGWSLFAGGSITREIVGKPDDFEDFNPASEPIGGYFQTPVINAADCPLKYRATGSYTDPEDKIARDSEPDNWFFSLPNGKSGKFFIPKNVQYGVTFQPVTKPQMNIKIALLIQNSPPYNSSSFIAMSNNRGRILSIELEDDEGKRYSFEATVMQRRIKAGTGTNLIEGSGYFLIKNNYVNTDEYDAIEWKLTKILDINTGESIVIEYEEYLKKSTLPRSCTRQSRTSVYKEYTFLDNFDYGFKNELVAWRIKAIHSGNSRVDFEYNPNSRCDAFLEKAIVGIIVRDGEAFYKVKLNHVYGEATGEVPTTSCLSWIEDRFKWLMLKSISLERNGLQRQVASFDYNLQTSKLALNDARNKLPPRFDYFLTDKWGYYNGGNIYSCPGGSDPDALSNWEESGIFCPNYSNNALTEIGTLKKLNYPSGASSSFEYEANTALPPGGGAAVVCPGIRVKKIIVHDGIKDENNQITEYKYLLANGTTSGYGFTFPPLTYQSQLSESNTNTSVISTYNTTSSNPVANPQTILGAPVGYSRVEELTSLGKTVYEFKAPQTATINYTFPFANNDFLYGNEFGYPLSVSQLTSNNQLRQKTIYTYNTFTTELEDANLLGMKTGYYVEANLSVLNGDPEPIFCNNLVSVWGFTRQYYKPRTGRLELASQTVEEYFNGALVGSKMKEFEYDPTKFYLKKEKVKNQLGEDVTKYYHYPYEFATGTNQKALITKGIEATPVGSVSILKRNNLNHVLSLEKSTYKTVGSIGYKVDYGQTSALGSPVQITASGSLPTDDFGTVTNALKKTGEFTYDSEGRIVQVNGKGGQVQSAIWDHDLNVVVAKSTAPYGEIAFSSFETNYKGGWDYPLEGSMFEFASPAGKKAYQITNRSITRSNLNPGNTYYISYFHTGSLSIPNAIQAGTKALGNGWNYYLMKITDVTSISITGTGFIDDLKLYPVNAGLTSLTYERLTGLTSESAEGNIISFIYDGYGRLLATKDEKGKLIKVFCYSNKGEPKDCNGATIYKNVATSFTVSRNNCTPGNTTSPLNYTIPEGRYLSFISQADVDQMVQKDMETFGQSHANQNGTCSSGTVYAKLSYENVQWIGTSQVGDVVVRFFSDAAGSVPVFVVNLNIKYANDFQSMHYSSYTEYQQSVSGSYHTILANHTLSYQYEECDYGTWPCYLLTANDDFILLPLSGYTIIN